MINVSVSTQKAFPDDLHKTTCMYSEIQHPQHNGEDCSHQKRENEPEKLPSFFGM